MIRSIAYSRYFSTATPTHTGRIASPSVPTTCQYDAESPEACALITAETTSATAPLYSHLSCWRRSPADRRYFGTCTISQTRQLARIPNTATLWTTAHTPEALAAKLPLGGHRDGAPRHGQEIPGRRRHAEHRARADERHRYPPPPAPRQAAVREQPQQQRDEEQPDRPRPRQRHRHPPPAAASRDASRSPGRHKCCTARRCNRNSASSSQPSGLPGRRAATTAPVTAPGTANPKAVTQSSATCSWPRT